jgi:hypothetical protein
MHHTSEGWSPGGHDHHDSEGPGHARRAVARSALLLLALAALYQGIWAQLAPRSFYENFPGGMSWVASEGPFNEHLVRDIGGLVNGLGVVALVAAWTLSRPVILANTLGWLVYALPHLAFHVVHPLDDVGMQVLNVCVLTSEVLLPLAGLLALTGRRGLRPASGPPRRHSTAAKAF